MRTRAKPTQTLSETKPIGKKNTSFCLNVETKRDIETKTPTETKLSKKLRQKNIHPFRSRVGNNLQKSSINIQKSCEKLIIKSEVVREFEIK